MPSSGTESPCSEQKSEIGAVHHAIVVDVSGTPLRTWSPVAEHETEVTAIDDTVAIDVTETGCVLGLELHDERAPHVVIEGVVDLSTRPVEIAEEAPLLAGSVGFSGSPGVPRQKRWTPYTLA